jgi:hypothetical protein
MENEENQSYEMFITEESKENNSGNEEKFYIRKEDKNKSIKSKLNNAEFLENEDAESKHNQNKDEDKESANLDQDHDDMRALNCLKKQIFFIKKKGRGRSGKQRKNKKEGGKIKKLKTKKFKIHKSNDNNNNAIKKCFFIRRKRGKYITYNEEEKKNFIEMVNQTSIKEVSNIHGIQIKLLYRWIKYGCQRKKGCGRKIIDEEMEKKLVEWINKQKKTEMKITRRMITDKALSLSTKVEFKASQGWFHKFVIRYNIEI